MKSNGKITFTLRQTLFLVLASIIWTTVIIFSPHIRDNAVSPWLFFGSSILMGALCFFALAPQRRKSPHKLRHRYLRRLVLFFETLKLREPDLWEWKSQYE